MSDRVRVSVLGATGSVGASTLDIVTSAGKGAPEFWVAVVKPGRMMFEIAGVDMEVMKEAMRLASHKLPCQTRVVERIHEVV